LGTINSVVLTNEYMKSRGIPVKGIIYNNFHPGDVMEEDNIRMCEHMTGLPTLALVQPGDTELDMDADVLADLYE
ncbi:MAG: AAA family ATPase, partial [Eubacterium sp.]|nr:AAA family ATPase [Candidatus Colimonas fimequi]